jgi:hypothetical protein
MYYIFQNGDEFGFKCSEIHEIIDSDILISNEIYKQFFDEQGSGKVLRIKNIKGATFEEIFDEYQPIDEDLKELPLSETEELKQRVAQLEAIVEALLNEKQN